MFCQRNPRQTPLTGSANAAVIQSVYGLSYLCHWIRQYIMLVTKYPIVIDETNMRTKTNKLPQLKNGRQAD